MVEYFEVHYILPGMYDVHILSEYKGKPIKSKQVARKLAEGIKKAFPSAQMVQVVAYANGGIID